MPAIKSSADLRNNYNEISTFCHNYPEPVFITKNGKGDLAVMSIETYEELTSRFELYSQIKEGMDDIATGNTRPFSEAMADIRSRRSGSGTAASAAGPGSSTGPSRFSFRRSKRPQQQRFLHRDAA